MSADRLRAAAPAARLVLIDGPSGAGKSSLALRYAAARPGVRVLALDEIYPGWGGLEVASAVLEHVLRERAAGRRVRYPTWDWTADAPGPRRSLAPAAPLVVEGCGAITRRTAALADLSVWVTAPAPRRRSRAMARDGDVFAPHWSAWSREMRAHEAREHPRRLADLTITT